MTVRHPGISPINDLVAKKIFSNPEITCQFIRDMLDLPAKNVTILDWRGAIFMSCLPCLIQPKISIQVLMSWRSWTMALR